MLDFEISAPWGDFQGKGYVAFFEQCIAQLQHFLDTKVAPNEEHTKNDIRGYQIVIERGEDFAERFAALKDEARQAGKPFKDNLAVVAALVN